MSRFILVDERLVVNLDHVTDARFAPRIPAYYNEEYKTKEEEIPATLKMWLTSTTSSQGEGAPVSESRTITVRGNRAEVLWDVLKNMCGEVC